ncbi:MAG: hypothetical protein HC859_03460 [Bacteroidia bacterium]|nr:hypothetical protein [Bacteroidia bacterium]
MRIRKEIEKWNWRTFATVFAVFFIIYNVFTWLGAWVDKEAFYEGSKLMFWVINGFALPLMLGVTVSFTMRGAKLFINDFKAIPSFKEKLHWHIARNGFVDVVIEPEHWAFKPKSVYYRLMKSWFNSENLLVEVGDEIVIKGPLRKISGLEDVLTGNADFKVASEPAPR